MKQSPKPFAIDPENADPGPTTVRRLNRVEYGNTIRELMGVPFNEKLYFPADDSGHGFDNVADALSKPEGLLVASERRQPLGGSVT